MPPNLRSKKPYSNEVECKFCHKRWDAKGIGNHRRACEKKHLLDLQQREYEKQVAAEASNSTRKFCFVSASVDTLIILLATGDYSRLGPNLKPWEQYGRIGK
jgi:hypothetical protein